MGGFTTRQGGFGFSYLAIGPRLEAEEGARVECDDRQTVILGHDILMDIVQGFLGTREAYPGHGARDINQDVDVLGGVRDGGSHRLGLLSFIRAATRAG